MRKIIHLSVISVSALLLLLITIVFTACNSSSGDNVIAESKDGVHFFTGTLEAASALSKKENKPIFLLAHASYCSSCKKMKRSIFPLKEVGEVFNKSFIIGLLSLLGPFFCTLYSFLLFTRTMFGLSYINTYYIDNKNSLKNLSILTISKLEYYILLFLLVSTTQCLVPLAISFIFIF